MRSRTRMLLLALLALGALLAAACGGDDDTAPAASGDVSEPSTPESDDGGDELFPVTVKVADTETTIETRPTAIVSMSPAATEMLFAINAGGQVVAVDSNSNFPEDAPTTDLSAFEPNVEAIIALEPDLVVLDGNINDVVAGLEAADITPLVLPAAATIDDVFTQIEVLGAATGRIGEAAELVAEMQVEIDELVAQVPERDEPLTYYHELDDTLYSVTSETFIGEIYALAGLENVADAADPDGANGGYPQLSVEYLLDADPDLIFLADVKCCGQDAATVAGRPGWDQLTAVQDARIVELDDDVASRWGPRIVDLLEVIVEAMKQVDAGADVPDGAGTGEG